jgi:Insertion element 4 transposase N-terminal
LIKPVSRACGGVSVVAVDAVVISGMKTGSPASRDQVSIGVLVKEVPRDAVDEAVAVCGVRERRSDGKLPAHVVTYLTLALCLFAEDDYEEVATKVTGSLDRFGCWDASWSVPTASAITQARKRLGRAVFPELFERVCGPVAGEASRSAGVLALGTARGSFLRSWRLLAIDGFEVDVPDTAANTVEFGYAGSGENRSAFPKPRVVALAECGTHAFLAAEVAAYSVGENTLAQRLYPRLRADELLTADRGSTPGRPGTTPPRPGRRCPHPARPTSCRSCPTAPT